MYTVPEMEKLGKCSQYPLTNAVSIWFDCLCTSLEYIGNFSFAVFEYQREKVLGEGFSDREGILPFLMFLVWGLMLGEAYADRSARARQLDTHLFCLCCVC